MPEALDTQHTSHTGQPIIWTPAVGGDGQHIEGGGRTLLLVRNTGDSTRTVTVESAATLSGLTVEDQEVEVADGGTVAIGPFRATTFDRPPGVQHSGRVVVTYSAGGSDLECAAIRLGGPGS